ncbi:MAG: phosphopyruvate hydratase [Legionellales bacterium RIFCSPHIGHO2_12_FULL_35_11]|nr:MAG: phosphopyruvate hydratase [Legionellales bacterium RIFCSPHIGHO2_12_FULL_35_11]
MQINNIIGREILDSRGNPTVEVDIILTDGTLGRSSVPSGASTGTYEAYECRDGDSKRYAGMGVMKAVEHINHEINSALRGMIINDQEQIDKLLCDLDGTENKSRLGGNAILAVSLAYARASASANSQSLFVALHYDEIVTMPIPLMNVLNGGVHADNNLDIQEFMLMPIGAPNFPTALQMGVEVFHVLKSILKQHGLNTAVGDEGGFAPNLQSNSQALDILTQAIEVAGFNLGQDIALALDVAASEIFQDGYYHLTSEKRKFTADKLIDYYQQLVTQYPIISIEDGLDEHDWDGWHQLTLALGSSIQLVGDDIFVTNKNLLSQGIQRGIANAILIKPNQIGTLTETKQTIRLAQKNNYKCIISHRSGETEDTFIADLAVATGCGQIKTGSLCRTERVAKYNQLLRIYEYLNCPYAKFKIN